jgi:hypothetical protein
MQQGQVICAIAFLIGLAFPQGQLAPVLQDHFVIARHTFFDLGPPNDYYELLLVGPDPNGASVERITLIPTVDVCLRPAQMEVASASLSASPATLLGNANPCAIPEKELQRELERCKNCLVFSGVNISMEFQCGSQLRIVRSEILDKDMFDARPNTPKHTSWTMQLLARLDEALGPGVMEKPIFQILDEEEASIRDDASPVLRDLGLGKYDALFEDAPDRPSDLYHSAQLHPATPSVRLESASPFKPIVYALPQYPPIGEAAHVEGAVSFKVAVGADGGVSDVSFDNGPPLLRGAVKSAVSNWKFAEPAFNKQVAATIDFALNCLPRRPAIRP